jgi:branched-chain amino acid transport system permease protein
MVSKTSARDVFVTAVFAIVVGIVLLSTDNPFYLNIFVFIGIYALLTMGLSLVFGFAGQISVAHAAFYGMGSYASAYLTLKLGAPSLVAVIAAMLIPAAIAYLIGRPVLRLKHFYLAMATLALGDMASVLFVEQRWLTGGFVGLAGVPPLELAGFMLVTPRQYAFLVWFLVGLVFWFCHNLIHSKIGRALRAINGSDTAAAACGVDIPELKTKIFSLSAAFAGLAGSLYAHYVTFISPEAFTSQLSIILIVMLYIGGLRSLWGALLGSAFSVIVPELLSRYKGVDVLVYGAVLLAVMMFLPQGLAGVGARIRDRVREAVRRVAPQRSGEAPHG